MEWLARSADTKRRQDCQTYARHVLGVRAYAEHCVTPLVPLLPPAILDKLRSVLLPAAEFHDLGKLDDDNQAVLRGEREYKSLPIVHSDAGVVELVHRECFSSALLVASHHVGLLNLVAESNRGDDYFRVEDPSKRMRGQLEILLERHRAALSADSYSMAKSSAESPTGNEAVFIRMALSCLVDADHTDSSQPNRPLEGIVQEQLPPLEPERRLAALDDYVSHFESKTDRDALRRDIYTACRNQVPDARIVACDSPVGSGKTTSVMAHLLAVACKRGLRRIFVVLPFTNIIRQSAEVYRKALVLPGENPDEIVAEVHHLADFDDEASRDLAVRWNAPIVVTTAVAFFETLAAARPSALRRLHELAGAAVFVDEAHAALPAKLLPVAWRWMQAFADEWNVHWTLASGSLVRFWEMEEVLRATGLSSSRMVPLIATNSIRDQAACYEQSRVSFETFDNALSVEWLLDAVERAPGPRLVILNTVQNAAVIARAFANSNRFSKVYHLSTALTPADRETTLSEVKKSLVSDGDGDWVLVGTSCIEAGMDLDFATGFREIASLTSLLQSSGRVNRSGNRVGSKVYSFRLLEEGGINRNKSMEDSVRVLQHLLDDRRPISADLCTEALRRELQLDPRSGSLLSKVCGAEDTFDFPEVEKLFKIIGTDTRTVVVGEDLVRRIESFEPIDWREIQKNSVQIWGYRIDELRVPELHNRPGVYGWHLAYSPFIGFMEGILELKDFDQNGGGVL